MTTAPQLSLAADIVVVCLAVGCCLGGLLLRPAWRLAMLAVLAEVDFGGAAFSRLPHAHAVNALRLAAIPALALIPVVRPGLLSLRLPGRAVALYSAFVIYIAATCLWTPFPGAGVKLVAYLVAFGLTYVGLVIQGRNGMVERSTIHNVALVTIALGAVQTLALHNPFGTLEHRFTGFCSPQSYAVLLVALILGLAVPWGRRLRRDWALLAALSVVLALDGSREFTATLVVALIGWAAFRLWPTARRRWRLSLGIGLLLTTVTGLALWLLPPHFPDNRLSAVVLSIEGSNKAPKYALGTLTFRTNMWHQLLHDYAGLPPLKQIAGAGAAAGGRVAIEAIPTIYTPQNVDANRVIHSEYLRTLYEFGVGGLLLLAAVLTSFTSTAVRRARRTRAGLPMLLIVPTVLVGLGLENLFAEGMSAAGLGVCLVGAISASSARRQCDAPGNRATRLAGATRPAKASVQ